LPLELIKQGLNQNGLHVALNMKQDLANDWHLLKKNGTIDYTIDKSRLPYMVQTFVTTEIESVMFVAKVKGNPAAFTINVDGAAANFSRVDELKLLTGINSDIDCLRFLERAAFATYTSVPVAPGFLAWLQCREMKISAFKALASLVLSVKEIRLSEYLVR